MTPASLHSGHEAILLPGTLESRVAPAALVTLTLAGHDLLISGDNGGATVELEQLPSGELVFSGSSDTLFKLGAAAPASLVFVKGVTGAVTVNLGSGSDSVAIETLTTVLRRASVFTKDEQTELGASSPAALLVGIAGDAQRRASFGAAAVFRGGAGINDTLKFLNAIFLKTGAPTVTGFEL